MNDRNRRAKRAPSRAAGRRGQKDGFLATLLPLMMGMALCVVCLCGTTWAWFSASSASSLSTIQTARFSLQVKVMDGEEEILPEQGVYALKAGKTYEVTILPSGDADSGSCRIEAGEQVFKTVRLIPGQEFSLKLEMRENQSVRFDAQWSSREIGTVSEGETCAIGQNGSGFNPNPDPEPGDEP